MINWKLISTLLSEQFHSKGFGSVYFQEYLFRSWRAHFDFDAGLYSDQSTMSGNYALFYDFFMTLSSQKGKSDKDKVRDIVDLLQTITGGFNPEFVRDILVRGGYKDEVGFDFTSDSLIQFGNFHKSVIKHSGKLFEQRNYFHAVHEACKAYNNEIKAKAKSEKDGVNLMQFEFGSGGSLRVNNYKTQSEINEQNGIKSLSEGLVSAFRNPTSHENSCDWPITKEECINILNLVSYLFKKLDKATLTR